MKTQILKYKPKHLSDEEFIALWNRTTEQFDALTNALIDMKNTLERVNPSDFDIPNHYAKMSYQAGQAAMIDRVLGLLPSIDNS